LYNRSADEVVLPPRRPRRLPRLDARRLRFLRGRLSARRLAAQFGVPKRHIVNTLTATLLFRPVGAIIFGMLADRYGRRIPLMANVIYFSIIELLSGFSQTYTQFLILRALFGIGMGGEWGVGASLAMEQAPRKWRGVLSGILQSGYSIGYLLAAVASRAILPSLGWSWMFWLGALPALLALYIRTKVPSRKPGRNIARRICGRCGKRRAAT
jgi:SHS family lactate transporter-like MFS transporter